MLSKWGYHLMNGTAFLIGVRTMAVFVIARLYLTLLVIGWRIVVLQANYAINPTPELYLRSNRALLPARVIAALGFHENFLPALW